MKWVGYVERVDEVGGVCVERMNEVGGACGENG